MLRNTPLRSLGRFILNTKQAAIDTIKASLIMPENRTYSSCYYSGSDKSKCKYPAYCRKKEGLPRATNPTGGGKKSMWDPPDNLPPPYPFQFANPDCCEPYCTKPLPRFDELYYYPSCKDGPYQRTWNDCPMRWRRPKCCYEKLDESPPRQCPRPICCRPKTACPPAGRCPKITMCGCGPVRSPPSCKRNRRPTCCQKLCAPMPSWSECKHPELAILPQRPMECFCLAKRSVCDLLAYQLKLEQRGISGKRKCP